MPARKKKENIDKKDFGTRSQKGAKMRRQANPKKPQTSEPAVQLEHLIYIRDMIAELHKMSMPTGEVLLTHLLEMAMLESNTALSRAIEEQS